MTHSGADREAYRGDERFPQMTALNHMANAMGFPRFNGFKAQSADRLPHFMEENALRLRRDVLAGATMDAVVHDRFSPISTGKYKSMKIGFRLVYETDRRV